MLLDFDKFPARCIFNCLWVELGYVSTMHVLILFSVWPLCPAQGGTYSQKHNFFCPLSGGVFFFCWRLLGSKVYAPNTVFIKVESLCSNQFFSEPCARQMEMTVRKSTFQVFQQVYIVG